jgi:hypothetical protein
MGTDDELISKDAIDDPISSCEAILKSRTGNRYSDEKQFCAGTVCANRPQKKHFGIDAGNIVIESSTGNFYLVDPT